MLRKNSNAFVYHDMTTRFRQSFEADQFLSPIFRHKSSATWPFNLKPGSNSLIFVEFVVLGFDLGADCTLERL
jgi:hypothetical protein